MSKHPPPPPHLSPSAKKWWVQIVSEFELESHHLKLLQLAAESWDSCEQASKVVRELGLTYCDRFGAPRLRPEVAVMRDSRLSFARLCRELDLDYEAPTASRAPSPPALRSNRR